MARRNAVRPQARRENMVVTAMPAALSAMMRQVDADLRREHEVSHTEYLVLKQLSEATDRRLGMTALGERSQQSAPTVSRTIRRLEGQGLVRREKSSRDLRAYTAVLTDEGWHRYVNATATHDVGMRRYLLDHLEGVDLDALGEALQRIANAANSRAHSSGA
jgi:DNA-binding MarR family transcriptional regulator